MQANDINKVLSNINTNIHSDFFRYYIWHKSNHYNR